jgi:dihydropteroate synthase
VLDTPAGTAQSDGMTVADRIGPRSAVSEVPSSFLLRLLAQGRPVVMGVLNVTPDSFSDGGRFLDPTKAVAQAERLVAEGANIIDIGAESTRPYGGAVPVSAADERERLAPIFSKVVALGAPVSIDTIKAETAAWALDQGAAMINDVWGLQRDPGLPKLAAARQVPIVIMHNRDKADPAIDILADIEAFFRRSLAIAERAGIAREQILLDPGIGFGKTPEQSMAAIAQLGRFKSFGLPLLVGASRKRFISAVTPSEPGERLGGSLAAHLLAVENGAAIVRVHDVAETVQALAVAAAIRRTP